MSIGDLGGLLPSAAGSPLQQRGGAEADRRAKEANDQRRSEHSQIKAEKAAGVGETDEDAPTSDRDADGRRLWEKMETNEKPPQEAPKPVPKDERKSKDTSGESGGALDLLG